MQRIYNKILHYSNHPQAVWILFFISFLESFISPIPPDLLMILIIVANRSVALKMALWCTVASVLGGVIGYYIGYAFYQTIGIEIIHTYGYESQALRFQELVKEWGFWLIALKSLTPIPFKVVTILSGLASMDFWTFVCASIIGRGSRFLVFALFTWYFGAMMRDFVHKRMGLVIGVMIAVIIFGFWLIKVLL